MIKVTYTFRSWASGCDPTPEASEVSGEVRVLAKRELGESGLEGSRYLITDIDFLPERPTNKILAFAIRRQVARVVDDLPHSLPYQFTEDLAVAWTPEEHEDHGVTIELTLRGVAHG